MRKYGNMITISVEVDISMSEFDTDDLIRELERRGKMKTKLDPENYPELLNSPRKVQNLLRNLFKLHPWSDKIEVLKEVEEIFKY